MITCINFSGDCESMCRSAMLLPRLFVDEFPLLETICATQKNCQKKKQQKKRIWTNGIRSYSKDIKASLIDKWIQQLLENWYMWCFGCKWAYWRSCCHIWTNNGWWIINWLCEHFIGQNGSTMNPSQILFCRKYSPDTS